MDELAASQEAARVSAAKRAAEIKLLQEDIAKHQMEEAAVRQGLADATGRLARASAG